MAARWLLMLAATVAVLLPAAASAADPQAIVFRAASHPWSALRLDIARMRGETLEPRRGEEVAGYIYRPARFGKAPAVVLLPGCRGLLPYHREWARQISGRGYVVLLVDRFARRGATNVCAHIHDWQAKPEVGGVALDALGALAYLATLPDVDPDRIGLVGWAFDGTLNAVMADGHARYQPRGFAAAIAFYPSCINTSRTRFAAPLLVLMGERDDWTPAADCVRMAGPATRTGASIRVRVYPGAFHAFDDPEAGERTVLPDVWNPSREPTRGGTIGYRRDAHDDAIARVDSFLAEHLQSARVATASPYAPGDTQGLKSHRVNVQPWIEAGTGSWSVDPAEPGPSRPPAGRSLFDHLFSGISAGKPVWDLPFPFDRLVARLSEMLAPDPRGMAPVKQVLVPLGRSLQREAAAPEFFRYPRVVVGVDSEPAHAAGEGMLLKDRLYIGYQEAAQTLEVISWNQQAGRFEFQIVRDYARGQTPRVVYANRAICTACHQNQAPIFARASWLETNANFLMAGRLEDERRDFYGLAPQNQPTVAFALDTSTDRASLLPTLQLLWSEGCGTAKDGDPTDGARCRAAAFEAMVQYRLTGSYGFDRLTRSYGKDYAGTLARNWEDKWPGGLMVADADLADRDPMSGQLAITPELDPLTKRPPRAIWSARRPRDLDRLIVGMASTLTAPDIARLSDVLARRAMTVPSGRFDYDGSCRFDADRSRGARFPWHFRCRLTAPDERREAIIDGSVTTDSAGLVRGEITRFAIDGVIAYSGLDLRGSAGVQGNAANLTLWHPDSGLRVMLPDGQLVVNLAMELPAVPAQAATRLTGRGTLSTLAAFAPVDEAIDRWIEETDNGQVPPVLSSQPFRGQQAMARLFQDLGLPARSWCCDTNRPLPQIAVETTTAVPSLAVADAGGLVGAFQRNCATCHRTESSFPPNFLAGDRSDVEANLRSCAPRIAHRLAMWSTDPALRDRSPMPPAQAVARLGMTPQQWRESDDYHALRTYVQSLMAIEGSARGEAAVDAEYDSLPVCLSQK